MAVSLICWALWLMRVNYILVVSMNCILLLIMFIYTNNISYICKFQKTHIGQYTKKAEGKVIEYKSLFHTVTHN